MMTKKLGKNPAKLSFHNLRAAFAMSKHLATLPDPPKNSSDYVKAVDAHTNGDWGMDGNDQYGDCTCADEAHQTMLYSANLGNIIIPTTQDTLNLYTAVTGFNPADPNTDQGAEITQICNYVQKNGFMGHKIEAYAPVDPKNLDHVKWGIQLFGSVKIGVNLPDSAETQFDNNQPWDVVAGATIEGGHDVCLVSYETDSTGHLTWDCVTWGKRQKITSAFFDTYCDEVEVPLSDLWLTTTGMAPSGFNVSLLLNELNYIKSN